MSGVLHVLFSCLVDSLIIYPLVYCGRVLDRFKLCCFLRRDGRIPDRVYILSCLLSAVVFVYACVFFLTSKTAVDWKDRYVYNLTTSHTATISLNDPRDTKDWGSIRFDFGGGKVDIHGFSTERFRGEDVVLECSFPSTKFYNFLNISWTKNSPEFVSDFNIGTETAGSTIHSQLTILNITTTDFQDYCCFLADQTGIVNASVHSLREFPSLFTRIHVNPGSYLRLIVDFNHVDSQLYSETSLHYKVNNQTDTIYRQVSGGCSPHLYMARYLMGKEISVDVYLFTINETYSAVPDVSIEETDLYDFEILLHTHLVISFCVSPERFGLYTFFTSRTFYNSSSQKQETVTVEHPWTILVEPRLPEGINWLLPGYDLIPVNSTTYSPAETYRDVFLTMRSDDNTADGVARIVITIQWFVIVTIPLTICPTSLYIYSKYAPGFLTFLCLCLIRTLTMIFPANARKAVIHPAIEPSDYDLFILGSEDSKYWVYEHIIAYTEQFGLSTFWEELLTPGKYFLSSSLDALHKARKVIVVISPDCSDDGYFCHQFECLSNRVVEGGLSPLRVMLVRKGNVDVDNFRRHHHQFRYFDWDNTVFRAEAFERKLAKWLFA